MSIKVLFYAGAAALGSFLSWLFGGWNTVLAVLLTCLALDYATGLIVAGIFHKSPKTANGGLESRAGWKGLLRKVGTLLMVAVAHFVDVLLSTVYIRDAVVMAFCVNEILSLLENFGLMGLPIPKALANAVELLRKKEETK
jgi:toxin secretion/phage lysis holin